MGLVSRFLVSDAVHGNSRLAKPREAPLVKLPYVMIRHKEFHRPEELRGKTIGIARAVFKKFNIRENKVAIRPLGGSRAERFHALRMNIVQAKCRLYWFSAVAACLKENDFSLRSK